MDKAMDERLLERDIDKKLVEFVIKNPIETFYDQKQQNYKSFALVNHPLTNSPTYLMIVHSNKFNTEVSIISAMWQTSGGLQRNGFSKV